MSNQGRRKYEALKVVEMFATLTEPHWRSCLQRAASNGNVDQLMRWRYGMQAGLADAVASGMGSEKLDIWVIKRIRNVEQTMKYILRQKYPMPGDLVIPKYAKGKRIDYVMDANTAKKKRDHDFEMFLRRSSF